MNDFNDFVDVPEASFSDFNDFVDMPDKPSGATRSWEEPSWGAEDTLRATGAVLGGFAAMPVAGLGGLAKLITSGDLGEASKTMEGISSVPTEIMNTERQRRTAGKVGELISTPFVMAGEGWRKIGEATDIPYAEPILGSMGEVAGMAAMPSGVRAAKWAAKEGAMLPVKAVGTVKQGFFPKPSPDTAMRQVLQSKGKEPAIIEADVEKGWDAFAAIDTAGNKKFVDTVGKIREGVKDYSEKVDAALMKDTTIYGLDDLATTQKTKGGSEVTSNYVKTALDNLEELYTKIEDPVNAGNIKELRIKAETEGLTKKEVNDIARTYGLEKKAFNKATGEPLTSVSAEAYENIRSGLKEVARRGMGPEAKELDSTISSLLNTERLLKQNAAASMKLQQRYAERGWGDKVGGVILDAINLATFGGLKGLLRKALPSNVSLKQRNSAEIEGKLSRNLKIINDEIRRLETGKPQIGPTGPAEGPPPDLYPEQGMNPGDILETPPPRPNLSGPLTAPETATPGIVPEIPPGLPPSPPEIVQPGATSGGKQALPDWLREELERRGWDKRKLNDVDLRNESVRKALDLESPERLAEEGIIKRSDGTYFYEDKSRKSPSALKSPEVGAGGGPANILNDMMGAFNESAGALRKEISNVRYGMLKEGKPGEILFDFRGKTYTAPESSEVMPVGHGEASNNWALQQLLDKKATPIGKAATGKGQYEVTVRENIVVGGRKTAEPVEKVLTVTANSPAAARKAIVDSGQSGKIIDISKKDMTPTQGMTFREAQDLFKKHK